MTNESKIKQIQDLHKSDVLQKQDKWANEKDNMERRLSEMLTKLKDQDSERDQMMEKITVKEQELKRTNDQLYRQKGSEEDLKQELEAHIAVLE